MGATFIFPNVYYFKYMNYNCSGHLRTTFANLMPHWEHFEIDRFALLLATIDLEFISFSYTYCEKFQTHRSREYGMKNTYAPLRSLFFQWNWILYLSALLYTYLEIQKFFEILFPVKQPSPFSTPAFSFWHNSFLSHACLEFTCTMGTVMSSDACPGSSCKNKGTRHVYKLLSRDTYDLEWGRSRAQRWHLQASVFEEYFSKSVDLC